MSKELILKLESDLEELEKLIQTKQSLLVQAFENHTTTPISEIITKVKEITLQKEFIVMKQGITDFKTLKESLRTDITKEDINFIEELQKKLLHFKELFEHELKEEQKLNSEDTNLESIKNKIQELREEFKELESSKNILFELLNKHSKSNTLKIKEAREYLSQFNCDYLKTISDEFVVDLHNLGLKSGEKANDLFIFGIPAIMPFVEKNPSYWPQIGEDLVSLSLKVGTNNYNLFRLLIPEIMPFVEKNPILWKDLVYLGLKTEKNVYELFEYGIFKIMHLIKENPSIWPQIGEELVVLNKNQHFLESIEIIFPLIEENPSIWPQINIFLIKLSKLFEKYDIHIPFESLIPLIRPLIKENPSLWPQIEEFLIYLIKRENSVDYIFFKYACPAIMPLLQENPSLWLQVGKDSVELSLNSDQREDFRLLFSYCFSKIIPFIKENPSLWSDLVKLSFKTKDILPILFDHAFPTILPLVKENPSLWPQIGEDIVNLGLSSNYNNVEDLFKYSLPAILPLIKENPSLWPGLVRLGIASGNISSDFFKKILIISEDFPSLWPQIGIDIINLSLKTKYPSSNFSSIFKIMPFVEKNPSLWPSLVSLRLKSGENAWELFEYGIPVIMPFVEKNPSLWPQIGEDLVSLGLKSGVKAEMLFKFGIPAVMPFVEKNPSLWPSLVSLGLKSGENAWKLFEYGIPAIMPFVEKNPSYWPQIGEDLVSLSLKSGENVEWLFEYGIPAVMPFVEENKFTINKALQFLDFLIQKYPERIEDLMITLTDVESEINSDEDLNLFWSYIKDFSILDLDTFKYYKSLNPEQRKKHLNNCIERYQKIVNGEKIKYTKEDLPFLYHAINSRNLSQNEMKSTLQKYEQQIHSLPKLNYDEFEFSIKEVREIKLTGSLTEKLFNYYREMFKHITQTKEILKINYLDYFTNNKKIEQPTLGVEYSSEIAWRSIIYNIYQNLGEDTQNKINKILNLEYNSNHKELSEVYYALEELYNDTVKDNPLNLDDKTQTLFLEYHRSLSQIDKLLKEVKKFKEVEGEGFKLVKCYPSKEPIDLFYGYYGENCTSSAPAELLNPNFLPVRLIIDNQIQGCLHFYFTEFGNKKILAILGIEPRSWLCNNLNNKKFFDECLKSFIKFAKKYNFDMVALPVNPTMHSNRGQISSLIAEEIRNKKQIDLNPDIEFPKNHEGYKTNGLRVIWKKGFF